MCACERDREKEKERERENLKVGEREDKNYTNLQL